MSTSKGKTSLKVMGGYNMNQSKVGSSMSKSRVGGNNRSVMVGGASRTTLSSSRRSQIGIDSKAENRLGGRVQHAIQVFDDAGNDVTPQPLNTVDPNIKATQSKNVFGGGESSIGTPTDLMSQASIYQAGTTSFAGPFTQSVFGTSITKSSRSASSFADDFEPEQVAVTDMLSGLGDIQTRREVVKEELGEEDLDKIVDIQLSETDTIWLIDMRGVCVSAETDEAPAVTVRNEKYKELCKNRDGNDRYMERGMQTFNDDPKNKTIQTNKIVLQDVGAMATNWDMYDTYLEQEAKEKEEEDRLAEEGPSAKKTQEASDTAGKTASGAEPSGSKTGKFDLQERLKTYTTEEEDRLAEEGPAAKKTQESSDTAGKTTSGAEPSGSKTADVKTSAMTASVAESDSGADLDKAAVVDTSAEVDANTILQSDELKRDLFVMERVVTLNSFQPKQAAYRDLPIVQDIDRLKPPPADDAESTIGTGSVVAETVASADVAITQLGPNLDRLWAYTCNLTKGRNVSCMSWNKINSDLLAVGYGQFGFTDQKGGIACCWSLKNPEYPERVFQCEAGVTAMDFSNNNPNLLAIGMYNGTVAVYNVRSSSSEPVLDSYQNNGKHGGPVWQLKWIDKEKGTSTDERGELLISISTDGRVTQWQIRKGFEFTDLMKLKRVAKTTKKSKDGKEPKSEGVISRQGSGLCFDFNAKDPNIYLAGTEDGHIHKCSCSYNEQYLDTFFGHTSPVHKIEWSPFLPDVFLSCSADWSLRLWLQDRMKPVINFHSSTKAVMDLCWSPTSATVFGCVNEGAVEIWDLNTNMLDPIIVNVPAPGVKLSCLTFARNSDCIFVGDSDGQVSVYQLRCMPTSAEEDTTELLSKLIGATIASHDNHKKK